jgi:hypothetical protein
MGMVMIFTTGIQKVAQKSCGNCQQWVHQVPTCEYIGGRFCIYHIVAFGLLVATLCLVSHVFRQLEIFLNLLLSTDDMSFCRIQQSPCLRLGVRNLCMHRRTLVDMPRGLGCEVCRLNFLRTCFPLRGSDVALDFGDV